MSAKNPVPAPSKTNDALLVGSRPKAGTNAFSIDAKSMDWAQRTPSRQTERRRAAPSRFEQHHKALLDDQVVLYRQYVKRSACCALPPASRSAAVA